MSFDSQASVTESDQASLRLLAILVPGWTLLFLLASVALVLYGDVLMAIFA